MNASRAWRFRTDSASRMIQADLDEDHDQEIADILPYNNADSDFDDDDDGEDRDDQGNTEFSEDDEAPLRRLIKPGLETEESSSDEEVPHESSDQEDSDNEPLCNAARAKRRAPATSTRKKPRTEVTWERDVDFEPPDTEFTGPEFVCDDVPTPLEAFKLFMTDEIFEIIADETILYADGRQAQAQLEKSRAAAAAAATSATGTRRQSRSQASRNSSTSSLNTTTASNSSQSSTPGTSNTRSRGRPKVYHTKSREFSDEDRDGGLQRELHRLFAALFRMGITQMPNIKLYWSENLGVSGVKSLISSNRFFYLMRHLRFRDKDSVTDEEKKEDRLWKMRKIIDILNKNFQTVTPEEHNSVDEQMIAFKGRSILRQYMPNKPIRYGFKVWARAGASGFVYQFDVYQGKGCAAPETEGLGMGASVVVSLINSLPPNVGHKIFADRFFTGLGLVAEMTKKGYLFCGTVNKNRLKKPPLIPEKELKKMERGTSAELVETNDGVCLVQWLDNKEVLLISNYVGVLPIGECKRYDRSAKKHIIVPRPAAVAEYNTFMGGVDLSDMLRAMYAFSLKCRRWYMYVFIFMLNLTARNAWLYYRRCCAYNKEKAMPLMKFLEALADDLAKVSPRPVRQQRRVGRADGTGGDHIPVFQDQIGECVVCTKRRQRHRSYILCEKCNKILCCTRDRNCFKEYHQK